ncbi:hypothetical protein [Pontibacter sp. G13]|uniref:hypothetical protein n=1 Tax=Pontibacter sp. G13 TaxID=3074898 RepID=UPI00288B2356|nr:hypothetical protein [Pontibacter sp. G13]WNJ18472.1 hypothetical protein RJD25_26755 [Pontibacter sp. G13]
MAEVPNRLTAIVQETEETTFLKLQYAFATNSPVKAAQLSKELGRLMHQTTLQEGDSTGQATIEGTTRRMVPDSGKIQTLIEDLFRMGYHHDCELTNWELLKLT